MKVHVNIQIHSYFCHFSSTKMYGWTNSSYMNKARHETLKHEGYLLYTTRLMN